MKDYVKRHLDLEHEEISIHFYVILAFMLNFKIYFYIYIRPPIKTKEKRT